MFEKLVKLLDKFDTDNENILQFFAETYHKDATKLLERFSEDDWKLLMELLPKKSNFWKERLIYCLDDGNNKHYKEVILKLLNTDDYRLFRKIIFLLDSSYFYFTKETVDMIINKMNYYYPNIDVFDRRVFSHYKSRILDMVEPEEFPKLK